MTKFYVTTPIYYVNDKPHIGHAYTTVVADIFARFYRQKLGNDNVLFLTGTDEHGAKVVQAAEASGQPPQVFVDSIAQLYQATWSKLNISYDYFFRTTDPKHTALVQQLLQQLYDQGLIYKATYNGVYCIGCEKYLNSNEIVDGKCPLHPNIELTKQEEENYFFKLKDLAPKVQSALEAGEYRIVPPERHEEIISRIKGGVEDISISRPGVAWGIPLPWDTSHTVYVWVDALFNYYVATQILDGKSDFWPADLHLMAKDILWFHGLIWEALLLALNKPLPKTILAHGFFTIDCQKMSKSLGNVLDPIELADRYGTDGLRYLLVSAFAFGNDGDISLNKFTEKYNADLANGIGNLISRVATLCHKTQHDFSQTVPVFDSALADQIDAAMSAYRPDEALRLIWQPIQTLDKAIDTDQPWTLADTELIDKLEGYVARLLGLETQLQPFLPDTAAYLRQVFGQGKVTKPTPLFTRQA